MSVNAEHMEFYQHLLSSGSVLREDAANNVVQLLAVGHNLKDASEIKFYGYRDLTCVVQNSRQSKELAAVGVGFTPKPLLIPHPVTGVGNVRYDFYDLARSDTWPKTAKAITATPTIHVPKESTEVAELEKEYKAAKKQLKQLKKKLHKARWKSAPKWATLIIRDLTPDGNNRIMYARENDCGDIFISAGVDHAPINFAVLDER